MKKALNLPILISLVVGNMIGTGIYVLPASLAPYGAISLIAWLFTSAGAIFLAITFTNLTKRFPETGGPYIYCKEAFGDLTGAVIGYIYWLSYMVSVAAVVVASVGYIGFLFPILNSADANFNVYYTLFIEIILVWIFTLVNLIGLRFAGSVQIIMTVIKILPLILISIIGLKNVQLENFFNFNHHTEFSFSAVSNASTLVFWAFIGLETATVPADETRGFRDIYRATVYGTLLACVVYIVSTFVLMGMMPATQLEASQFPFATAATTLFGTSSGILITICAIVAGLGVMNVCILLQGQIVLASARDNLFPSIFKKLSKRDVPYAGLILSSIIVSFFLLFTVKPTLLNQFNNVALIAVLLTLITYFACMLAEIKFLWQTHSRLKFPLFVAFMGLFYSIWTIFSFEFVYLLYSLAVIFLLSFIYYTFIGRKK